MKRIFALVLLAGLSACSQPTEFSADTKTEKLQTLEGSSVTFSEILEKHKGKTLVIEVWASWCGDCVKAMPKFKALQAAHPEADYVFVSMDKAADKWKSGIEKHQLKGDHYWATDGMKGSWGTSVSLDWIPRYIIVGKDGKIATWRAVETDFDSMETTLTKLRS